MSYLTGRWQPWNITFHPSLQCILKVCSMLMSTNRPRVVTTYAQKLARGLNVMCGCAEGMSVWLVIAMGAGIECVGQLSDTTTVSAMSRKDSKQDGGYLNYKSSVIFKGLHTWARALEIHTSSVTFKRIHRAASEHLLWENVFVICQCEAHRNSINCAFIIDWQ